MTMFDFGAGDGSRDRDRWRNGSIRRGVPAMTTKTQQLTRTGTPRETPWPPPWRIAAALALESGLAWARWAFGLALEQCSSCGSGLFGDWTDDGTDCCYCGAPVAPVPDPSDAEAYRADCARRGVEPGPMPALHHNLGGDGVSWIVRSDGYQVSIYTSAGGAAYVDSDGSWSLDGEGLADLARLSALATAAARAMGAT
jgi:hypothetical protein